MTYRIGFFMDQIAGHITNYRNLVSVTGHDPEIEADWHEIHYYRPTGAIERVRRRLPFIPTYYTGILRGSLEMRRAMRHYRQYDAILTNASVALFFNRALAAIPTMLDFDSTPIQLDQMSTYEPGKANTRTLTDVKWRLTRRKFEVATLLQAWSNWAKASVVADYGIAAEKVIVNPPGVNLELWKPPAERVADQPGAPVRVLFVGGDFARKGGPLLLEWYKYQDPQQCELHIVTREPVAGGPGVYVYNDMQPNSPRLIELYQRSHLFVLPSLGECFGIATVEAMGAGLPVIATDIGGTADIIEPGRNGFIIPSNDLPALTQAITAILADKDRREEMGRQSRLLATQRFDLQENARRTLSHLKQIARPASKTPALAK